jgi:hypothetical protein
LFNARFQILEAFLLQSQQKSKTQRKTKNNMIKITDKNVISCINEFGGEAFFAKSTFADKMFKHDLDLSEARTI